MKTAMNPYLNNPHSSVTMKMVSDEDDTDPHIRAKVYALPEESSGIGTAHAEQTIAWPKHGYASRSNEHFSMRWGAL
jgi:hypothetical protein